MCESLQPGLRDALARRAARNPLREHRGGVRAGRARHARVHGTRARRDWMNGTKRLKEKHTLQLLDLEKRFPLSVHLRSSIGALSLPVLLRRGGKRALPALGEPSASLPGPGRRWPSALCSQPSWEVTRLLCHGAVRTGPRMTPPPQAGCAIR